MTTAETILLATQLALEAAKLVGQKLREAEPHIAAIEAAGGEVTAEQVLAIVAGADQLDSAIDSAAARVLGEDEPEAPQDGAIAPGAG